MNKTIYNLQSRCYVNFLCSWCSYWRAGASQPSRTTGTIFLYNYVHVRIVGRVHIVRMRMRGICVPFAIRANQMQRSRREAVETAESGRCVYPSAEHDIHVVRRRDRLATETTEERETSVPAL